MSTPPGIMLYYDDFKAMLENCNDEKIATIMRIVFISYCEMTGQTDNKIYASRMSIKKFTGLENAFLQLILDKMARDKKKYDEKIESQRSKGKKSHSKGGLSQSQPRPTTASHG